MKVNLKSFTLNRHLNKQYNRLLQIAPWFQVLFTFKDIISKDAVYTYIYMSPVAYMLFNQREQHTMGVRGKAETKLQDTTCLRSNTGTFSKALQTHFMYGLCEKGDQIKESKPCRGSGIKMHEYHKKGKKHKSMPLKR